MISIVVSISVLFAVTGFFLIVYRCVNTYLTPRISGFFKINTHSAAIQIFLIGISWTLSTSLRGLISVWGYYLGIPIQLVCLLSGVLGLVFVVTCRDAILILFRFCQSVSFKILRKTEWILFIVIVLSLLCYLYRTGIPWLESDEMTVYGFLTKLMANGWSFTDIIDAWGMTVHSGPKMTESLDAQLYLINNNTFFVRIGRLIGLVSCSLVIYSFLRLFHVNRFWSLFSVACFLGTPEFSSIAVSLKVDSAVMTYELSAMLLLGMIIWGHWTYQGKEYAEFIVQLSAIALILASAATGSRKSGMYVAFITLIILLFSLYQAHRNKYSTISYPKLGFLLIFVVLLFAGYWANMYVYGNPIFPFKAAWPFNNGEYIKTIDDYRSIYNIVGLPPIIKQLYLILYMGLDLEKVDKYIKLSSFLPFVKYRSSSMSEPFPLLLSLFMLPFFTRYRKILCVLGVLFVYQLFMWSSGVHYSRVFLASSSVSVVIASIMAALNPLQMSKLNKMLQNILRACLIILLFGIFSILSFRTIKLYNYAGLTYTKQQQYDFLYRLFYHSWYRTFKTKRWYKEDKCPKRTDIKQINRIISNYSKAYIGIISASGRAISVLFKDGFFMEYSDTDFQKTDIIIINKRFPPLKELFPNIRVKFPSLLYESSDHNWKVLGKIIAQ